MKKNRGRKKPHRGKRNKAYRNKAVITHIKGQGIPDMLSVKLSYVEHIPITTLGGLPYMLYNFRGNSLFDPNVTGTGHQPMYFDQYAALYNRYRVMGSAVKIDVINNSGVSALFYVCEPNTIQSTTTDLSTLYEQSRSGAPRFVPIAARIASRLKRYVSTRKVCGLTKPQIYDDVYSAATIADPGNIWYWNFLFGSVDGTAAVDGHFIIKITYYAQFYDRLLATQS